MNTLRYPGLLIVTLFIVANLFGETPPTKKVRIKPRKIEVDNRQFGSILVEDYRANKENIGYLTGIGKFKTYLELDESIEKVFSKFLQESLPNMENGQTIILRVHNIECRNMQKFNSVTAVAEMEIEILKKTPLEEEPIFKSTISKEYRSNITISGRTFGKLIEDILEACLKKGNQALENK